MAHDTNPPDLEEPTKEHKALSEAVKDQLLFDFSNRKHKDYTCHQLLSLRPDIYFGPHNVYRKAARNRYWYIRDLYRNNREAFDKILDEAEDRASGVDFDEPPPAPAASSTTRASWMSTPARRSTRQTAKSRTSPTRTSTQPPPPPQPRVSTPTNTPVKLAPAPTSTSKTTPAKKMNLQDEQPELNKYPLLPIVPPEFKSIKEAIEYCDYHFFVDFNFPEGNPHGLFVHLIKDFKLDDKKLINKVKVWWMEIGDFRDLATYKYADLVLNGRALIVYKPGVPFFWLKEQAQLQALERIQCERSNNSIDVALTSIELDKSRWTNSILIIFPENDVCHSDLQSDVAPVSNLRIKIRMRAHGAKQQPFYPGFHELRSVKSFQRLRKDSFEEEEEDELAEMFAGMIMETDD